MNGAAADHLDDFTLAALLLSDLPPTDGAQARRHLDGCAACAGRFSAIAVEAGGLPEGDEALALEETDAAPPLRLLEVARPDGGAVLLFPTQVHEQEKAPSGMARLASRVLGRFEHLLHAAAGAAEVAQGLTVASGEGVHALSGAPGETLSVWFGNPHPQAAWLTVLRQPLTGGAPPVVVDGPRRLAPGRQAGDPTQLRVEAGEEIVLALLTRDPPPPRERLDEALALGAFGVFDDHGALGQVACRVTPR